MLGAGLPGAAWHSSSSSTHGMPRALPGPSEFAIGPTQTSAVIFLLFFWGFDCK